MTKEQKSIHSRLLNKRKQQIYNAHDKIRDQAAKINGNKKSAKRIIKERENIEDFQAKAKARIIEINEFVRQAKTADIQIWHLLGRKAWVLEQIRQKTEKLEKAMPYQSNRLKEMAIKNQVQN